MLKEVLFITFFALPGALANMAPVFAASGNWLPQLKRPLDFGRSFRDKRILGDNKTFRGVFFGFIFALATAYIQLWLYNSYEAVQEFSLIDYATLNLWGLAGLMTLGALGGDAVKSFFKRQLGHKPGQSWMPFDQIDSVLGLLLVSLLYLDMPTSTWIVAIIVGGLLHPTATTVAWLLRLKESPL